MWILQPLSLPKEQGKVLLLLPRSDRITNMTIEEDMPDEETAEMQREEVQALEAIFDGALDMVSSRQDDEFDFPIVYTIKLNEMDMDTSSADEGTTNWPKQPLVVRVTYPRNYPSDIDDCDLDATLPSFKLLHDNTVLEFPSRIAEKLMTILRATAESERGMPSVMSCLYAARDFLDGDREWETPSERTTKSKATIMENTTPIACPEDIQYACLSTHHLLDHKPDNLLRTGHKYGLKGFYKFGTPGVAIVWGDKDNIDDFLDMMKKEMPQKKFELVFCRSWSPEQGTPEGWKSVDPQGLREEMVRIGAPEEDYYTALGLDKNTIKQGNSKGKNEKK